MKTYCVKCKKVTAFSGEPKLHRTKNDRLILKGVCVTCNKIKRTFEIKKEGKGLSGKLFKLPSNKIPVLGDIPIIGSILFFKVAIYSKLLIVNIYSLK